MGLRQTRRRGPNQPPKRPAPVPFHRVVGFDESFLALFERGMEFEVVSKMQDVDGVWRIHLRELEKLVR